MADPQVTDEKLQQAFMEGFEGDVAPKIGPWTVEFISDDGEAVEGATLDTMQEVLDLIQERMFRARPFTVSVEFSGGSEEREDLHERAEDVEVVSIERSQDS